MKQICTSTGTLYGMATGVQKGFMKDTDADIPERNFRSKLKHISNMNIEVNSKVSLKVTFDGT